MNRLPFVVFTVLAIGEIVTLGILLENLFVGHVEAISRLVGPIHGSIYLVVALIALLSRGIPWSARLLGLVPIVGGLLAVVRVGRARPPADALPSTRDASADADSPVSTE